MSRRTRATTFAALSILWCATAASAETLRCQSVNGNLNCAGSDGVACQTVDGKKTCVSGHGGVVQSFGKDTSTQDPDDTADSDDDGLGNTSPSRPPHSRHQPPNPGTTR